MVENFFGMMKSELLYAEKFELPEAFIKALEEHSIIITMKESILIKKSPVQYRPLSQIG
jgi:putative transposase